MGFYPFCPGSGEYLIGIPNFDKAIIHLANKKEIKITTNLNNPQQQFIHHITECGENFKKCVLSHDELMKGKDFTFDLGMVPNLKCFDEILPASVSKKLVQENSY